MGYPEETAQPKQVAARDWDTFGTQEGAPTSPADCPWASDLDRGTAMSIPPLTTSRDLTLPQVGPKSGAEILIVRAMSILLRRDSIVFSLNKKT